MLPKMLEDLLSQDQSMEDFRSMFIEGDIDHSGTLSVDEIYSIFLKKGTEVTVEELVELLSEIDVDRNGELDIDEFVAFMNMGQDIQFNN
jgi:calcium-binding protein CML